LTRNVAGLAILLGAYVLVGCNSIQWTSGHKSPHICSVGIWVPLNYLAGSAWPLNIPVGGEAESMLHQRMAFRTNPSFAFRPYTVSGLCKEITRVTGKRIVWLPEESERLFARIIEPYLTIPIPGIEHVSKNGMCEYELHDVLCELVSLLTNVGLNLKLEEASVWTALVGYDAIFLVKMPLARGKEGQHVEVPTQVAADQPCEIWGSVKTVPFVIPENRFTGGITRPDVLSPGALQSRLCMRLSIVPGKYSFRTLSEELTRVTGDHVVWMPDPKGDKKTLKLFDVQGLVVDVPSESGLPLAEVLDSLGGLATELGIAFDSPDREMWSAVICGDSIMLIMLPGVPERVLGTCGAVQRD